MALPALYLGESIARPRLCRTQGGLDFLAQRFAGLSLNCNIALVLLNQPKGTEMNILTKQHIEAQMKPLGCFETLYVRQIKDRILGSMVITASDKPGNPIIWFRTVDMRTHETVDENFDATLVDCTASDAIRATYPPEFIAQDALTMLVECVNGASGNPLDMPTCAVFGKAVFYADVDEFYDRDMRLNGHEDDYSIDVR